MMRMDGCPICYEILGGRMTAWEQTAGDEEDGMIERFCTECDYSDEESFYQCEDGTYEWH